MVRLKVCQLSVVHKKATKFQFQNGAIKSICITTYNNITILFQFQNGAIKRLIQN